MRVFPLGVLQERRPVDERPGRIQLGGHVGQFELGPLEADDRTAELHPLLRIAQGCVEGRLGDTQGGGADGDAEDVQRPQGNAHPVTHVPQEVFAGHEAILELQLHQVVGRDHLQPFMHAESRHPLFHDEGGEGFGVFRSRRLRERHGDIGRVAVRDEPLQAVEDKSAGRLPSLARYGAHVASRFRFGKGIGRKDLARTQPRQEPRLLLVVARQDDRITAQPLHRKGDIGGTVDPGQLFPDQADRHRPYALASQLLGHQEPEELRIGHGPDQFSGYVIRLPVLRGERCNLLGGKDPALFLESLLIGGKQDIHMITSLLAGVLSS